MKSVVGIALRIIVSFSSETSYSQSSPDSYELKTVVPPSPDAAALGKYGDIPVSYHTGVPNISIPLYELKEGDVSLPVSLSYHASGIRVAEVASWVGLGWTLNAGGVITRSVQHVPDEGPLPGKVNNPPQPYYVNGGTYHTGYYRDGFTLPPGYENVENFIPGSPGASVTTINAMKDAASGNSDAEPDMFSFNIGGYSGKFFFKVDRDSVTHSLARTPYFIPRSDVKVEVQYGNLSMPRYPSGVETRETFIGFTLTTPDGIKYRFGGPNAVEYTGNQVFNVDNHSSSVSVILAPSSWYLTRIESPIGHHIDIEYTPNTFGYYDLAPERCWGGDQFASLADQMISRNVVAGVKLSRIHSGIEEILFYAENLREDLSNYENHGGGEEIDKVTTKRLDRIEIKEIDGAAFKKFRLGYSYFRSTDDGTFPKFIENSPDLKRSFTTDKNRLRLDNITGMSGDETIKVPPYQFTYIEADAAGANRSLPRRLSYQQDHWGYFNHETGNTGLTAFWAPPRKNRRQTNDLYTQLGTLKSIRYPMGGVTTFIYESHEAVVPVENMDETDPGRNYVADSQSATGNGATSIVSFATVLGSDPPGICVALGLACNTFSGIILKFRAGSPTGGTYNLDHTPFNISPAIEIYRQGDMTPIYRYDFGYLADCSPGDLGCSIYNGGQPGASFREIARIVSFDLPAGQYYAKTYRYEGMNPDKSRYLFTAAFDIQIPIARDPNYEAPTESTLTKIGGLRIKSIVTSDGAGITPDQQRTFSYPPSGGVLFYKPQYYYKIQYLFSNPSMHVISGETFQELWSSGGVLPPRSTQGYHIGYAWVKEEQRGNGYKVYSYDVAEHPYHFNNDPYFKGNSYNYESTGRQYNYPVYPAPIDLERGNLLSEEVYNSNSKLVMSTLNSYESPTDIRLMRASKVELIRAPVLGDVWYVGYTHYPVFTSTNRIKTTTVNTNYDENGQNPASIVTTYNYGGVNHLQATSVARTMDVTEYVDKMVFPPDYGRMTSTIAGIGNLIDHNIVNVPIEKYTVKNGLVISGTITQYKSDQPLPDAFFSLDIATPVPENIFTRSDRTTTSFLPDAHYKKRISYDQYDEAGNLTETSKDKDIHVSYIWGYSNTRPIADIRNATASQVFHTSFEDLSANYSDSSFTGNRSWKGSYLVKSPGPGTYQLTYWKKAMPTSPWQLVETWVTSPATIGDPQSLIDEIRVYPPGALMTTYTYNISSGITSITDPNNLVTRYFYDAMGRLQYVKDHNDDVKKSLTYHYKNQ